MSENKWKMVKWSTGLLSLYLDWRLRKRGKRRPLDILLVDRLVRPFLRQPTGQQLSPKDQQAYQAASKQAIYWHGTGKLQHTKKKVVDVFEAQLKQQGLRPFKDIFDVKQGEMLSISVARQRMYARIYADMHAYNGVKLSTRYGSPRFWAYYFIMAINLHAVRELGLWNPKVRRRQEAKWREQGKKLWTVKVTKRDGDSVGQFFNEGSDIPGNYPILIGLKKSDYTLLKTAAYVARYERRIGSTIPVDAWSHLEVQASKIDEITDLLDKYGHGDIPVFAIEQCERHASDRPFSELVRTL
jgi:hypothetical protein